MPDGTMSGTEVTFGVLDRWAAWPYEVKAHMTWCPWFMLGFLKGPGLRHIGVYLTLDTR